METSNLTGQLSQVLTVADQGLMTSLMTSSRNNLRRIFGAKYLANEVR